MQNMFWRLHFKDFFRPFQKSQKYCKYNVTIWRNINVAYFFPPDNGTYLLSQIPMYRKGWCHQKLMRTVAKSICGIEEWLVLACYCELFIHFACVWHVFRCNRLDGCSSRNRIFTHSLTHSLTDSLTDGSKLLARETG